MKNRIMASTSQESPNDGKENGPLDVLWEDGERLYRRMWRNMSDGSRREFLVVSQKVPSWQGLFVA